jgi:hypothetical protein
MERIKKNKKRGYLGAFIELLIQNAEKINFFRYIKTENIKNHINPIFLSLHVISGELNPENYHELSWVTISLKSTKSMTQLSEKEKNYIKKRVIL